MFYDLQIALELLKQSSIYIYSVPVEVELNKQFPFLSESRRPEDV